METIAVQIGLRMKDVRRAKLLTQEELGDIADISYKYLGMIERGERFCSIKFLAKIADALEADVKEFFDFPKSERTDEKARSLYRIWGFLKDRPKKELELAERMLHSLFE